MTWTTTDLHWTPCRMDGCTCGLPHPAYSRCNACRGRGVVVGGDAFYPCPSCKSRFARENPRAADAALDAVDRELQRAKEAR